MRAAHSTEVASENGPRASGAGPPSRDNGDEHGISGGRPPLGVPVARTHGRGLSRPGDPVDPVAE